MRRAHQLLPLGTTATPRGDPGAIVTRATRGGRSHVRASQALGDGTRCTAAATPNEGGGIDDLDFVVRGEGGGRVLWALSTDGIDDARVGSPTGFSNGGFLSSVPRGSSA